MREPRPRAFSPVVIVRVSRGPRAPTRPITPFKPPRSLGKPPSSPTRLAVPFSMSPSVGPVVMVVVIIPPAESLITSPSPVTGAIPTLRTTGLAQPQPTPAVWLQVTARWFFPTQLLKATKVFPNLLLQAQLAIFTPMGNRLTLTRPPDGLKGRPAALRPPLNRNAA